MYIKPAYPWLPILSVLLCLFIGMPLTAQEGETRIERGIELYGQGKWREAVAELRRASAEAPEPSQSAQALYWIALAELSAGEYEAAIQDLDELLRIDPEGLRALEAPYHKGRALYYLGRYDTALVVLKTYADSMDDATKKAAAFYWMGEALFALGRMEDSRTVFTTIVEQYPQSAKYEAASYRLALIDQKKIEAELLKLLKWSHEESLKTVEEYQRRERSYEQAIVAYQKRIAEMLKDTRLADLERSNAEFSNNLAQAEARVMALELELEAERSRYASLQNALTEATAEAEQLRETEEMVAPAPVTDAERVNRLLNLKAAALNLKDTLISRLGSSESQEATE